MKCTACKTAEQYTEGICSACYIAKFAKVPMRGSHRTVTGQDSATVTAFVWLILAGLFAVALYLTVGAVSTIIWLSIAALALYIAIPLVGLYLTVKFVKFAWKH